MSDILTIRTQLGESRCSLTDICKNIYVNTWYAANINDGYISTSDIISKPISYIDLNNITIEGYLNKLRKEHKGNSARLIQRAQKEGFYCQRFNRWDRYYDIVEINHSKEVRCGMKMSWSYQLSVDEYKKQCEKYITQTVEDCWRHWDGMFGVFKEDKLRGYIYFRRNGNLGQYSSILGHGDFLKSGIMYYLHFYTLSWVKENTDIDYLWYCDWNGDTPLGKWKQKNGFEKGYFKGDASEIKTA